MNTNQTFAAADASAAIDRLAAAFGAPKANTEIAASQLYEALTARVARNTLSRGGVADIVALLGDPSAGLASSQPAQIASPDTKAAGDHVLDVLIGDKHISRGIAARAAKRSGLSIDVTEKMLPAIASLLVGGLQSRAAPQIAQQLRAFPEIGDLLPMPGDNGARPKNRDWSQSTEPLDLPKPSSSGAGGIGGATGGGVILPMPGENRSSAPRRTRYDDLSDVVRKGGAKAPGGGSLAGMIRSILAGVLGFRNRGIIGSLIYMLLARFGMNLLRRILGRVFGGR